MMMVVRLRPNIFEASLGRQSHSHIWASIFTQNTNDVDMNYEIFFKEIFDREKKGEKKVLLRVPNQNSRRYHQVLND